MKEKLTLFRLLEDERDKFNLSKELIIRYIPSISFDTLKYFIDDIPYRLLKMEVHRVLWKENIEVFVK